MEKKYTVKEFVENIDTLMTEDLKENIGNEYVPFELKVSKCNHIVDTTYYEDIEIDGEIEKISKIDSPACYMFFNLTLVDLYSPIIIEYKDKILEEFNLLNSTGLLDILVNSVSEKEYSEFKMILEMVGNDRIQNENEIHNYIREQIKRFSNLSSVLINPIINALKLERSDSLE